jgi:hypothetical protein
MAAHKREMSNARPKEVRLFAGTRKGGLTFTSDLRRKNWKVAGPFFAGGEVNYLGRDSRTGYLWAATTSAWWGTDLQISKDGGKTWQKSSSGIGFAKERGLNLNRIWRLVPDRVSRPDVLWCGADPGALFRSDNGARTGTKSPASPSTHRANGGCPGEAD